MILRLGQDSVPDGSLIAFLSDIHIPYQDDEAVSAVIECCEREGVTHVVLGGDIADCGVASRHPNKKAKDTIQLGTLAESVYPGRYIIDWARTRPCIKIRGNHLAWVENKIKEDPALIDTVTPEQLLGWPEDGDGWRVLPSLSRVRLGSLCLEHGDGFFKTGSGGLNPAATVLRRAPSQTTIIGHLHRLAAAWYTVMTFDGIRHSHAAFVNGHLSLEEAHSDYMGSYVNWQQSFTLIKVYWVDQKPMYSIRQIEIHRDKQDKPIFEYNGKVYR